MKNPDWLLLNTTLRLKDRDGNFKDAVVIGYYANNHK